MRWQVIKDDNVAGAQSRGEDPFDPEVEHVLVHGSVDDPGRVDPVMAKPGNEGLGVPVPGRGMVDQPDSDRCPAGGLGHVGFQRGFVNKDKSFEVIAHERLTAVDPDRPILCYIRPLLLAGAQVFFYATGRAGAKDPRRPSVARRSHALAAGLRPVHQAWSRGALQAACDPNHGRPKACHDHDAPEVWAPARPSPASAEPCR